MWLKFILVASLHTDNKSLLKFNGTATCVNHTIDTPSGLAFRSSIISRESKNIRLAVKQQLYVDICEREFVVFSIKNALPSTSEKKAL